MGVYQQVRDKQLTIWWTSINIFYWPDDLVHLVILLVECDLVVLPVYVQLRRERGGQRQCTEARDHSKAHHLATRKQGIFKLCRAKCAYSIGWTET